MQTTYISSAIAFRSKSSVCYSSNDYYLNNRANRTSSCTCCAFPFNGVPVNPSFFNGLRQSTLIHWPASRRLILGGGDRFFRVPTSDFDRKCYADCHTVKESCQCCCTRSCSGTDLGRVCYGKSYLVKESCDCSSISRRRGKARRFKCVVWEEDSESCDSGIDGTMEAMLGLLAEEDSQNCVGVRGKNSSRLVAGRVQAEGRGISDYRKRESDCFKKNSKGTFQYVTKSREEEGRSSGRREGSLRGEKREIRKDGSSCSSYYSTLSSNEIDDSDVDVQVDQGKFSGESLNRHNKLLRIGKEDVSVKNVIKQSIRKEEGAAGYRDASTQGNAASTSMVVGSDRQSVYEREKNLRDVSIRRGESRIESIKNHLNVTGIHKISDETTSVSQNRFRGRVDSSISSTYSNNEAREQQIQQDESRKQSLRQTGMSRILDTDSDIEWASCSHTQFKGREESLAASVDSPEGEREIHNQIARSIGQNESRRKPQQFSRMLESHETDSRNTSNSQRQFESALKDREESSMSSHFKAEEQSSQTDQQVVWETKSTKESQDLSSISVINDNNKTIVSDSQSYSERRMKHREETSALIVSQLSNNHEGDVRTSNSERFCESTLKNKEESSTSLSSFHQAEDQNQTAQNVVRKTKSTNSSQGLINMSATSVRDSHKLYERRMSLQEENSASRLDFVQEASKGKTSQASEDAIKQLGSKKISERLTEISSFRESSANMASSSQPLNSAKRESGQQMDEKKENERNSVSMVTPPPAQILHGISLETAHYQEPSSGNAAGDVYSERPGSRSRTSYTQVAAPSSPNEINSGTRVNHSHENQSETIFDEDALGSANRLEESSVRFVRQFVENLSHEVSTSELPEEKKFYQRTSINKDAEYTQQSSNQSVLEDVHSQVHDSGRSSSRSAPKGPADEMWDVAGPSAEVPARTEAPGEVTATTENAIAKSGRSLWTIIGDIVRLRWGARSETHVSITKSGGKSSSNESVSSEAWFSSHEADEKDDENVKKGRRIIPKVRGSSEQSSVLKAGTQSLEGSLEGMSSNSRIFQNEADVFSSLGTVEGSSASTGASSKEESINLKLDERSEHGPPSTTTITPSSLWLSKPLTRSPAVKGDISESSSAVKGEIPDSSKPVASRRDFVQMEQRNLMRSPAVKGAIPGSSKVVASQSDVQLEQLGGDNPTRGSETEAKDGELKRRKLHRNKQVEKETFEDWEEAYRIENEQRKIDEMFMREALLEAKKAADTWEVPVGAVLVQHGKIVARGCNLVEDLRDSTAHAEMICIREASNILRTWRLSETTLYVTLEPCAMCAGAILQARIDTVVWGAPNKLLGADGSWVRLFPGEGEVGGSSNLPSQPSGPVHPFHPKITIRRGILATECGDVMQQFFQLRRKNKKSDSPPTSSLSVSAHPSKFFSKMHDIFSIMFCL